MGIPLIVAAIILFAAAYQSNLQYLITNLEQDVSGYFKWLLALMAIAAIGLLPKAKPIATGLLILVILVIFIGNRSFFDNLKNIQGSIVTPPAPTPTSPPDIAPGSGGGAKEVGKPIDPTDKQGNASGGGPPNILGQPSSKFGNIFGGKLNKLFGF